MVRLTSQNWHKRMEMTEMAVPVKFRVIFLDATDEKIAIANKMELSPGETREHIVADIMKNGFRIEVKDGDNECYKDIAFARRIAPNRILAVDYEMV